MSAAGANRPPRGLEAYERWTDRQVREAMDVEGWHGLDGMGKPLSGLDGPHDDQWWLRRKLAEEEVAVLPPSLLLRREVQDLLVRAGQASTEAEVRQLVEQANAKIRQANRRGIAGPPHNLSPYDPEPIVAAWRSAQTAAPVRQPDDASEDVVAGQEGRRRWWRRTRRPAPPPA